MIERAGADTNAENAYAARLVELAQRNPWALQMAAQSMCAESLQQPSREPLPFFASDTQGNHYETLATISIGYDDGYPWGRSITPPRPRTWVSGTPVNRLRWCVRLRQ